MLSIAGKVYPHIDYFLGVVKGPIVRFTPWLIRLLSSPTHFALEGWLRNFRVLRLEGKDVYVLENDLTIRCPQLFIKLVGVNNLLLLQRNYGW